MKRLMTVCALTAAVMAGSELTAQPLKVASYNILYSGEFLGTPKNWEARKDDVAWMLREIDADVCGLQEAGIEQVDWLRKKLPGREIWGEYRGEDRLSLSGSPIIYRVDRFEALERGTFWLSPTPDVPGSYAWGSAGPRICCWMRLKDKTDAREFVFANMHADHVSKESKLKSSELCVARLKEIAKGADIILVGDHNVTDWQAPAKAIAKHLKDAIFACEAEPEGPWRSLNDFKFREKEVGAAEVRKEPKNKRWHKDEKKRTGRRCDYIYVPQSAKVLSYTTLPDRRDGKSLYPSDHFPVIAEVELAAYFAHSSAGWDTVPTGSATVYEKHAVRNLDKIPAEFRK